MLNKLEVKYWLRSGSLRFVRESRRGAIRNGLCSYRWRGKPLYFRAGTSDPQLIYSILLKKDRKGEYWVPPAIRPSVILDIGANIGITSVYFANRFPDATIYSFEPVKTNFEILQKNVAAYANIRAFPVGLGRKDDTVEIFGSDSDLNHGGFSLYEKGSNTARTLTIELRNAASFLRDIGVSRVDMIKIDTEGSEYDILTALDENMLKDVQWIMGELHGERDFELLGYLSKWFDVGTRKRLQHRLFMFNACNKGATARLREC